MSIKASLLSGLLLVAIDASSAHGACFDVSKGEPSHLSGHLSHRIFAGPPNFEDVQKGDTPEPGYVLKLSAPICLTGDEFADPSRLFDEVQLVPADGMTMKMAAFRDADVNVDVVDPMPSMTGHHHRPLVAWVKSISSARDATASYGTAATTIEAFYAALRSGDGALASSFVVPEKTLKGPYAPRSLTRFYGSLVEPLTLLDIRPTGGGRFSVRYHFRSNTMTCNGAATVATVSRGGRNFIQSISAETGC
ncbi:hypothetical protein [Mesorhizobium comanense]|uniref:hypothetical protein n=1 Tax=Mesorhizobium comanense TaxID=2502215 RepID=UPI0010F43DB1|nr:hypothetical protein [Mesorhizobium comanense]DAV95934.1 MAG TPA: protein of unknown function (DUF4431) [Microviridae sp.]